MRIGDVDVLGFVASAVYASDEGGVVDLCRVRHPTPQLRLPHVPVRVDEAGRDEVIRSVDDGVDRCGVEVHADLTDSDPSMRDVCPGDLAMGGVHGEQMAIAG